MLRERVIADYVRGKDVLDCGAVGHNSRVMKQARGDWLHALVCKEARTCVGVDILKDEVQRVNAEGEYKFVVANVEELCYQEQFDVVLAGELVEHVYNMGLFLDSAWRALRQNGRLLITTPNAYSLTAILRVIVGGRERCHQEHTCYYSPQTIRYVIERHGFMVDKIHLAPRPARSRITGAFRRVVCALRPCLCETLVVVASKQPVQHKYDSKW